MTNYTDLIKRLQETDGADQELDVLIYCAVLPDYKPAAAGNITFDSREMWWRGFKPYPPLTASLDATLALVEEKLPGSARSLEEYWRHGDVSQGIGGWEAYIFPPSGQSGDCSHLSPAIALLIALLRTLEKSDE